MSSQQPVVDLLERGERGDDRGARPLGRREQRAQPLEGRDGAEVVHRDGDRRGHDEAGDREDAVEDAAAQLGGLARRARRAPPRW